MKLFRYFLLLAIGLAVILSQIDLDEAPLNPSTITDSKREKTEEVTVLVNESKHEDSEFSDGETEQFESYGYDLAQRAGAEAEQCYIDLEKVRTQHINASKVLRKTLIAEFPPSQLSKALAFLIGIEHYTRQQAMDIFADVQMSHWKKSFKTIKAGQEPSDQTKAYFEQLETFEQLLAGQNTEVLEQFLTDNPTFINQKYILVSKFGAKKELSYEWYLANTLLTAPVSYQQWLLERIPIGYQSIDRALVKGADIELLEEMLSRAASYNYRYYDGRNHITLLDRAVQLNNLAMAELLLEKPKRFDHFWFTPVANRLAASLIENQKPFEQYADLLQLLKSHDYHMAIMVSKAINKPVLLLERPSMLTKKVYRDIKHNDLVIRHHKRWPTLEELDLNLQYKAQLESLVNNIDQGEVNKQQTELACQELEQKYRKIAPEFLPLDDIETISYHDNSVQGKLAHLATLSPILVEHYLEHLVKQGVSEMEKNELDALLASIESSLSAELAVFNQVDQMHIHKQDYVTQALCHRRSGQALEIAFARNWYFNTSSQWLGDCLAKVNVDEREQLVALLNNRGMPKASDIFQHLHGFSLSYVLDELNEKSALHGYPSGRDSLAYSLDIEMVRYNGGTNRQVRKVINKLLSFTELQPMHFRRLHRLKLMKPRYFSELVEHFPMVEQASEHPVSRYHKVLFNPGRG